MHILLKKKMFFLVLLPFFLGVVLFLLHDFSGSKNQSAPQPQITITPFPTSSQGAPTITNQQTEPALPYNKNAQAKLLDKLKNKVPLSSADQATKQTIINSVGGKAATVQSTSDFNVKYIPSLDRFLVEITTTEINKAKQEATAWFTAQGFSTFALCDMPVSFYLNYDIAEQLRGQDISFNPLAEGC